jgi:hypothetical protein
MEKLNTGFDAFIEFSDLGLDDYILDIDWDIQVKEFPLSSHTFGDLRSVPNKLVKSKKQKIFKILGPLNPQTHNLEASQGIAFNSETPYNSDATRTELIRENNVVKDRVEQITEIVGEKIVEQVINNNSFNDNISVKIEESATNISDILNQKIEQSNSLTVNQITELEANMNLINHNHVYRQDLKIIQEQAMEQGEKIKKELKQDLESQKDFFTKFLNS